MMRRTLKKNFTKAIFRAGVLGIALVLPMAGWGQTVFAVSKKADRMVLVAHPKDKNVIKKFGYREPSLPTLMKPSTNPTANISRARSDSSGSPLDTLRTPTNLSLAEECLVDFSDYDALDLLEFSLHPFAEDTFAFTPWWHQACNGLNYVEVRPIWSPLSVSHFHLAYENPHITTCPGTFDFGIPQDDGTCLDIEPRDEPRYLHPHLGHIPTHIFVTDGGINDKALFQLNRIRVENDQAIQLCYKPMQEDEGPWESNGPGGSTSPGIWYCWNELPTGNWDLSDWTDHITEVKIQASHGFLGLGIYQIDDIGIGIY